MAIQRTHCSLHLAHGGSLYWHPVSPLGTAKGARRESASRGTILGEIIPEYSGQHHPGVVGRIIPESAYTHCTKLIH